MNIYKLGGNEGKGSIKAIINPELKEKLDECVIKLKRYGFFKEFCTKTKTSSGTLYRYLNKHPYIPLYILEEFEKLTNINLKDNIKSLEYGAGSTKRKAKVAVLSEDFVAIIGAFIADGHLKCRECLWGQGRKAKHYELVFREEYKCHINCLARWINNIFDVGIKPKKEKNHYSIYISNKIIFRYFQNILGFKSGRKTETVKIPGLFMNLSDNMKKSIIKGILMFDGSVSRQTGYVELYSKSRDLIKQVSELLRSINIELGYISLDPDKYGRYRLIIRKKAELEKCLELFEQGTEKHRRLIKILRKV